MIICKKCKFFCHGIDTASCFFPTERKFSPIHGKYIDVYNNLDCKTNESGECQYFVKKKWHEYIIVRLISLLILIGIILNFVLYITDGGFWFK